ncbi:hypothetical protein [Flindersiella endophytica]
MSSYFEGIRETASGAAGSVRALGIVPLLFRLVVFLSGFVALGAALPAVARLPLVYLVLAGVALVPAVVPGTWVVLVLELLAVVGWVLRTTLLSEPIGFVPLMSLAAGLYVHHVSSSWSAALPLSAVVTSSVWLRPLLRVAGVLALTGALAGVGLWLTSWVSVVSSVVVPVVGVLVALVLTVVLAVRARD